MGKAERQERRRLRQHKRAMAKQEQKGGLLGFSTAPPKYKGEKHIMLRVNGRKATANYAGPNTAVEKRVRAGDPPLSYVDKMAYVHDLERLLAPNQHAIKQADTDFMRKLPKAFRVDHPGNAARASQIIAPIMRDRLRGRSTLSNKWLKHNQIKNARDPARIRFLTEKKNAMKGTL